MNLVREFFAAICDGITKAAETLCPIDHTGTQRAHAAADALADVEAEVDHLEPSAACACGAGYPSASDCPWCSPEPPIVVTARGWEFVPIRGYELGQQLAAQESPSHYVLPVNDWIWPSPAFQCPTCDTNPWTIATMNGQYIICPEHGQIQHL